MKIVDILYTFFSLEKNTIHMGLNITKLDFIKHFLLQKVMEEDT